MTDAMKEMPRYESHKKVSALKIARLSDTGSPDQESDGSLLMTADDEGYGPIRLDRDYVQKHRPRVGGYYVVYEDGYESFSPAYAFEGGYTRI